MDRDPYVRHEYPKHLINDAGQRRTVQNALDLTSALTHGYKLTKAPEPEPEPVAEVPATPKALGKSKAKVN